MTDPSTPSAEDQRQISEVITGLRGLITSQRAGEDVSSRIFDAMMSGPPEETGAPLLAQTLFLMVCALLDNIDGLDEDIAAGTRWLEAFDVQVYMTAQLADLGTENGPAAEATGPS